MESMKVAVEGRDTIPIWPSVRSEAGEHSRGGKG